MAKVEYHPAVTRIRGKVKSLVFKRAWGRDIVGAAPDLSKRRLSEKQRAQNARFESADRYGRSLSPEAREAYQARARSENKPVYAVIVRDWFHKPCVEEIDVSTYSGRVGQTVRIRAVDDTEVMTVEVAVRAPNGQIVEAGVATLINAEKHQWEYTTTIDLESVAGITLEVTAKDRAGNVDQRSQRVPS
jgi:hypothetical protein